MTLIRYQLRATMMWMLRIYLQMHGIASSAHRKHKSPPSTPDPSPKESFDATILNPPPFSESSCSLLSSRFSFIPSTCSSSPSTESTGKLKQERATPFYKHPHSFSSATSPSDPPRNSRKVHFNLDVQVVMIENTMQKRRWVLKPNNVPKTDIVSSPLRTCVFKKVRELTVDNVRMMMKKKENPDCTPSLDDSGPQVKSGHGRSRGNRKSWTFLKFGSL